MFLIPSYLSSKRTTPAPSTQISTVSKAIRHRKYKKALSLIRSGKNFELIGQDGLSSVIDALHAPINRQLIQELIRRSNLAVLNYCEEGHCTALTRAASMREAKVVQWLAEAGVDLNCTDQFGNSSLMLAIERRPETPRVSPLARLKRRMKGKTTSPKQINLERMFETVQVLVRHGADIERANRDGITPLQMHLNNALPDLIHLGMVTFLVEHGANLKARVVPIGEDPQYTTKIQQVIQDAWGHRKNTILSGLNGNLPSSDLKKLVLEYEKLSTDSVSESILDSL